MAIHHRADFAIVSQFDRENILHFNAILWRVNNPSPYGDVVISVYAYPYCLMVIHFRCYFITNELIVGKGLINIIWQLRLIEINLT